MARTYSLPTTSPVSKPARLPDNDGRETLAGSPVSGGPAPPNVRTELMGLRGVSAGRPARGRPGMCSVELDKDRD